MKQMPQPPPVPTARRRRSTRVVATVAVALVTAWSITAAAEPADEEQEEQGTAGIVIGVRVIIKLPNDTVDGIVLDKLPSGYLLRVEGGTRVVAYADIVDLRVAGEPPPQPQTGARAQPDSAASNSGTGGESHVGEPHVGGAPERPPPPARAGSELASDDNAGSEQQKVSTAGGWPVLLGVMAMIPTGDHFRDVAISPADGFPDTEVGFGITADFPIHRNISIGADILGDITTQSLVAPGAEGCSIYLLNAIGSSCTVFPDGVDYQTSTVMVTISGKGYYPVHDKVRVWGALGVSVGRIWTTYKSPVHGMAYSNSTDVAWGPAFGAGTELILSARDKLGLAIGLALWAASPVYDEKHDTVFFDTLDWDVAGAGHVVNPQRVLLYVGGALPNARLR